MVSIWGDTDVFCYVDQAGLECMSDPSAYAPQAEYSVSYFKNIKKWRDGSVLECLPLL